MLIHYYANVILKPSLHASKSCIGVNDSIIDLNETNSDTNGWIFSVNEQQKVYNVLLLIF